MKILIADDDAVTRKLLASSLQGDGYTVLQASDGLEAWKTFRRESDIPIAVLDWMMPGMDGVQLCAGMRENAHKRPLYILILTARGARADVLQAFRIGVDDYMVKPFDKGEFLARVRVGRRVIELQKALADRVTELEEALGQVKRLKGLLPICSYCKKIRNDANYWQQVEGYIMERTDARFSHGVCPECYEIHLRPQIEEIRGR
jgi:DNA-binding response OmpR family regulator